MATTTFTFHETEEIYERTDIKLCANRWDLYRALNEVDVLLRGLVNGKTYREKYLYPMMAVNDETDKEELTGYVLNKIGNEDNAVEFIEVDYIVERLREALDDVRFVFDDYMED
jgi:hypothetical protein